MIRRKLRTGKATVTASIDASIEIIDGERFDVSNLNSF